MRIHIATVLLGAAALCTATGETSAQTRDTSVQIPRRASGPIKDEALATVLSLIVPGAGQLYAERPMKGVLILGSALVGLAMARPDCRTSSLTGRTYCDERYFPGAVIAIGAWAFGVATAPGDVQRYNVRITEPR